MTIADWLRNAVEDARRRGLPALEPLLESLSKSTAALREADRASRLRDKRAAVDRGAADQ